jgi:hypothetical protein
MACDLSLGRISPCKDSVGGLKSVYFINYGDMDAPTYDVTDTDVISTIGTGVSAYKYDIKGSSTFTQNIQSSRENGTTAFEQVLELTLPKLTAADHKEIKLLTYGRPHIIVEDYNGNYFLAGLENGMDVTGGTIVTGASMSELSGYTLTLTGMEKAPANFLSGDPTSVGATIVAGA